ncbi:hypothetical protein Poli38472_005218 [Pythium oligandrum]|uniref:Uncharacterized protein n=1 Tax=Pythium oligandrum TaxID=41045 RepID=A0A8K1CH37_PYTOL|nr:hypothetical protein Poli38472_005218 [Pythium oligandrum]|eukprot:TMW62600.1 hypothetical protein Poli38472_005218 [Pythium oligandrum]
MICSSVSVAAIGTACFFLPGSELFGDTAGEAITAVVEAGGHHVAEIFTEGANMAIEMRSGHAVDSAIENLTEVSTESSIERGVEMLVQDATASALNSLHQVLDYAPDALLKAFGIEEAAAFVEEHATSLIIATGEVAKETAPTIVTERVRRGLQPLCRAKWGMLRVTVSAVTIGTFCFFVPGSEILDCLADAAGGFIDFIADAGAEHLIVIVAEALGMAVDEGADHAVDSLVEALAEAGTETSIEHAIETFVEDMATSALESLHLAMEALPDEVLDILGIDEAVEFLEDHATAAIIATSEVLKETLPSLATGAVDTVCLEVALQGADSTVGVALHRQSKQEMAKYLQLKEPDLDPETARQVVKDVYARPVLYLTQYKELTDQELLAKEAELIAAAAIRANSLNFMVSMVASGGVTLFANPFDTISRARGAMLMYHNLSHCRKELNQRGIKPQFPLSISVSAGNAIIILSTTILRELPVPMIKQLIPDQAEGFVKENISLVKPVGAMMTPASVSTWVQDALRHPAVQDAVKQISSELSALVIDVVADAVADTIAERAVEAAEAKEAQEGQKQTENSAAAAARLASLQKKRTKSIRSIAKTKVQRLAQVKKRIPNHSVFVISLILALLAWFFAPWSAVFEE